MTNPTHTAVEVTQADREAAIELANIMFGNGNRATIMLRSTDRHFMLDAFARHRIASTRTVDTELLEALKPFAALQLPAKCEGNAAVYSILHKSILAARAAITKAEAGS